MAALGVVPTSRVAIAMDTFSRVFELAPPPPPHHTLTFKGPAPKLIISDEFNVLMHISFTRVNKMEAMNGG